MIYIMLYTIYILYIYILSYKYYIMYPSMDGLCQEVGISPCHFWYFGPRDDRRQAPRALGAVSWSRKGSPAAGQAMCLVFFGEQRTYGNAI